MLNFKNSFLRSGLTSSVCALRSLVFFAPWYFSNFSRNFSNSSADFRSQYLAGLSDLLQHYLDLQKKFTKDLPLWYDADLISRQSMMITKALVNTMHNMSSLYTSL